MIAAIDIPLCLAPICGSLLPPGSKSITNRALVCAALARGTSLLSGVLDSQDTRVMVDGLMALGVQLTPDWPRSEIQITGTLGKIPSRQAVLDCAASGTTIRFLSAVSALGHGHSDSMAHHACESGPSVICWSHCGLSALMRGPRARGIARRLSSTLRV